ncbi:response regulator, partial [Streptomyces rochei]
PTGRPPAAHRPPTGRPPAAHRPPTGRPPAAHRPPTVPYDCCSAREPAVPPPGCPGCAPLG